MALDGVDQASISFSIFSSGSEWLLKNLHLMSVVLPISLLIWSVFYLYWRYFYQIQNSMLTISPGNKYNVYCFLVSIVFWQDVSMCVWQKSLACCGCSWGHRESDVTNDIVTEQQQSIHKYINISLFFFIQIILFSLVVFITWFSCIFLALYILMMPLIHNIYHYRSFVFTSVITWVIISSFKLTAILLILLLTEYFYFSVISILVKVK